MYIENILAVKQQTFLIPEDILGDFPAIKSLNIAPCIYSMYIQCTNQMYLNI